jgi:hypothetical protein
MEELACDHLIIAKIPHQLRPCLSRHPRLIDD